MAKDNNIFDAPIPGQSLTAELGARPWQQPAQHSTVEDAFEFYVKKITDPEVNDSLLDTLEMGTPVTSISEIIVQSGAMEGKHTIDVSIQLLPVIMELIAYVAESSGIKYNMGIEKTIDQDVISESKIELAAKRIKDKMPKDTEEEMPIVEPETMSEESPQEGGIMSRRI
tara:strand:+ start:345 stop:854 length:510 start_codon:yes stop_codon:yes gene_type:complete